ncbi:Piso0_001120 [Millerozyma farinosa CBS 7064]|uniref:Piso0_001120 protein n=1 Tax=Pichia sorbitophila (strain ATCC MYA-4447 / BCRC 22081 / CBS 7064 / NBRC 10061 / NRRL Y-12695) TaxID=559304 RepID=G8YSG0_PICSO|nr:Piso0_001120 [Millerozyma farinosa CBS 7064]CCE79083.1 Piso0_001120 [Millerozyma farinosa CBS 7064]
MSLNSSDDVSNSKLSLHVHDELVPEVESERLNASQEPKSKEREVNFILDHHAFVRGIGNIKRWFNSEYVEHQFDSKFDGLITLNIYIPTYTLHEFEYVKRGTSMTATNARGAIKFIDKYLDQPAIATGSGEGRTKQMHCNLVLESPMQQSPSWEKCLEYKVHSPRIREFPNFKTKFASNLIGSGLGPSETSQHFHESQVEDASKPVLQAQNGDESGADALAEMPKRLKYLIKSCIYKRFIENEGNQREFNNEWKLVTEDPITKVWASSFGIDCLNVNDAELFLFSSYDKSKEYIYQDPHNFSLETEKQEPKSFLHNTVDTTSYDYVSLDSTDQKKKNKSKSKKPKPKKVDGVIRSKPNIYGESVKKEKFEAINYAPRGNGKLWEP